MRSHDRLRIVFDKARQNWRAFAYVMQVHENHYIKWAGVAGIRARAASRMLEIVLEIIILILLCRLCCQ
ncbi:hypothetical protein FZT93_18840 [Salmonella enterica subsp. enterica]|nr:hypothetical protein [Salmonella enterica subsp. enterica]EAZ9182579.1 hypothetical protein [Salmonella enterica]ECE8270928.1 hypothetical protein [Salmonella enterica subsp. enterica serovar Berkeley]ECQ6536977.1 hypothetical protein [Salmonella enterica subsp. enterica serovar Kingabwa]MJX93200.1 hypothetical protein [Salmonella enterica subsp. enterica serovar Berkeley]